MKSKGCFIIYQHCSYTKAHCMILVVCGDILSLDFQRKVGSCFFFNGWELTQTESNTESVLHQQPLSSGKSSPVWLFLLWTPPLCWQPHIAPKRSAEAESKVVTNEVTAGFWDSVSSLSVLAELHIFYLQNKKGGATFIYLFTFLKKKYHPFFLFVGMKTTWFLWKQVWKLKCGEIVHFLLGLIDKYFCSSCQNIIWVCGENIHLTAC